MPDEIVESIHDLRTKMGVEIQTVREKKRRRMKGRERRSVCERRTRRTRRRR